MECAGSEACDGPTPTVDCLIRWVPDEAARERPTERHRNPGRQLRGRDVDGLHGQTGPVHGALQDPGIAEPLGCAAFDFRPGLSRGRERSSWFPSDRSGSPDSRVSRLAQARRRGGWRVGDAGVLSEFMLSRSNPYLSRRIRGGSRCAYGAAHRGATAVVHGTGPIFFMEPMVPGGATCSNNAALKCFTHKRFYS